MNDGEPNTVLGINDHGGMSRIVVEQNKFALPGKGKEMIRVYLRFDYEYKKESRKR